VSVSVAIVNLCTTVSTPVMRCIR